jgi:hypothetical protein
MGCSEHCTSLDMLQERFKSHQTLQHHVRAVQSQPPHHMHTHVQLLLAMWSLFAINHTSLLQDRHAYGVHSQQWRHGMVQQADVSLQPGPGGCEHLAWLT